MGRGPGAACAPSPAHGGCGDIVLPVPGGHERPEPSGSHPGCGDPDGEPVPGRHVQDAPRCHPPHPGARGAAGLCRRPWGRGTLGEPRPGDTARHPRRVCAALPCGRSAQHGLASGGAGEGDHHGPCSLPGARPWLPVFGPAACAGNRPRLVWQLKGAGPLWHVGAGSLPGDDSAPASAVPGLWRARQRGAR